jgi:multiple sugar transport system substrate-binding protein
MRALLILLLSLGLLSAAGWVWRQARAGGRAEIELGVWGMPFENALYTGHYLPQFEREHPDVRVRFHHYETTPAGS